MSRGWKPGDVALVRNRFNVWNRAICSVSRDGLMWRYGVADDEDPVEVMQGVRALVVIDPEDREFVQEFTTAVRRVDRSLPLTPGLETMQAALRELVDPKPPCATCLDKALAGFTCNTCGNGAES